MFAEDVALLGMVSESIVPKMERSPIEFEVYFDGLVKGKGITLKLRKGGT